MHLLLQTLIVVAFLGSLYCYNFHSNCHLIADALEIHPEIVIVCCQSFREFPLELQGRGSYPKMDFSVWLIVHANVVCNS